MEIFETKMADFIEEIGHDIYGSPYRTVLGNGWYILRYNLFVTP
jgi:hypothetical protein